LNSYRTSRSSDFGYFLQFRYGQIFLIDLCARTRYTAQQLSIIVDYRFAQIGSEIVKYLDFAPCVARGRKGERVDPHMLGAGEETEYPHSGKMIFEIFDYLAVAMREKYRAILKHERIRCRLRGNSELGCVGSGKPY
jgi:hypothetical protein